MTKPLRAVRPDALEAVWTTVYAAALSSMMPRCRLGENHAPQTLNDDALTLNDAEDIATGIADEAEQRFADRGVREHACLVDLPQQEIA